MDERRRARVAEFLRELSGELVLASDDPTVQAFSAFSLEEVSTSTESAELLVTYRTPLYEARYGSLGLRRHVDEADMRTAPADLARQIIFFDLQEPLGHWKNALTQDDHGVWWWSPPQEYQ